LQLQDGVYPILPIEFPPVAMVWGASVRATHHFVSEADIQIFRPLVQIAIGSSVSVGGGGSVAIGSASSVAVGSRGLVASSFTTSFVDSAGASVVAPPQAARSRLATNDRLKMFHRKGGFRAEELI
jgi:hypothetical protein